MLPDQFIRVSVRGIGREIKEPQLAVEAGDERLGLFRNMRRPAVNDQKNLVLGPDHELRNSMNTSALTPPFSLIMNRIWPREVTAEIRLMRYRAPVLDTTGVSPFRPQVRPA